MMGRNWRGTVKRKKNRVRYRRGHPFFGSRLGEPMTLAVAREKELHLFFFRGGRRRVRCRTGEVTAHRFTLSKI